MDSQRFVPPRGIPCPYTCTRIRVLAPECKSPEAGVWLQGCPLQDRTPTSIGKQPPSPQLTRFLGDLRRAGSLNSGRVGESCVHLCSGHFHPAAPQHWSCRPPKPSGGTGARQTRAHLFCLLDDGWQGLSPWEKPDQAWHSNQAGRFAPPRHKSGQVTSTEGRAHFIFSSELSFPWLLIP